MPTSVMAVVSGHLGFQLVKTAIVVLATIARLVVIDATDISASVRNANVAIIHARDTYSSVKIVTSLFVSIVLE